MRFPLRMPPCRPMVHCSAVEIPEQLLVLDFALHRLNLFFRHASKTLTIFNTLSLFISVA